jgi:hypothetical protein
LFGDDWVQRQRRIVQQHANTYQRAAWGKALGYLSGSAASSGGLGSSSDGSSISKSAIKERYIANLVCVFVWIMNLKRQEGTSVALLAALLISACWLL